MKPTDMATVAPAPRGFVATRVVALLLASIPWEAQGAALRTQTALEDDGPRRGPIGSDRLRGAHHPARSHHRRDVAATQKHAAGRSAQAPTTITGASGGTGPSLAGTAAVKRKKFTGVFRFKPMPKHGIVSNLYLDAAHDASPKKVGLPKYASVVREPAPAGQPGVWSQQWVVTPEGKGKEGMLYSIQELDSGRFLEVDCGVSRAYKDATALCTSDIKVPSEGLGHLWYLEEVVPENKVPGSDKVTKIWLKGAKHQRYAMPSKLASPEPIAGNQADKEHAVSCVEANCNVLGACEEPWVWEMELVTSSARSGNGDYNLMDGIFTITQTSSNRLLDAYVKGEEMDAWAVTREVKFSKRQHFLLHRVFGASYTITQAYTGNALDVLDPTFSVVTRQFRKGISQLWHLWPVSYDEFLIVHLPTGRPLGAWEGADKVSAHDWAVYTAPPTMKLLKGEVKSSVWRMKKLQAFPHLNGIYMISQKTPGNPEMVIQSSAAPHTVPYIAPPGAPSPASAAPQSPSNSVIEVGKKMGTPNQRWLFHEVEAGIYEIQRADSFDLLTLTGDSKLGFNMMWMPNTTIRKSLSDQSVWYLDWQGKDEYRIRSTKSLECLSTPSVGAAAGAIVVPRPWVGKGIEGEHEKWNFSRVGDFPRTLIDESKPCITVKNSCPKTAQCGAISNGCGAAYPCAPGGQTKCVQKNTVTQEPHMCQDLMCICKPKDKCDKGLNCGFQDNGCGGQVACGNCSFPEAAGAFCVGNKCSCVPKPTCPANVKCGHSADGCGGVVECGPPCAPAPAPSNWAPNAAWGTGEGGAPARGGAPGGPVAAGAAAKAPGAAPGAAKAPGAAQAPGAEDAPAPGPAPETTGPPTTGPPTTPPPATTAAPGEEAGEAPAAPAASAAPEGPEGPAAPGAPSAPGPAPGPGPGPAPSPGPAPAPSPAAPPGIAPGKPLDPTVYENYAYCFYYYFYFFHNFKNTSTEVAQKEATARAMPCAHEELARKRADGAAELRKVLEKAGGCWGVACFTGWQEGPPGAPGVAYNPDPASPFPAPGPAAAPSAVDEGLYFPADLMKGPPTLAPSVTQDELIPPELAGAPGIAVTLGR